MNGQFPYEIKSLDEETNKEILRLFPGEKTGFVQVGPKKYFFQEKYRRCASAIYNIKVRPDDVWIVTMPRAGTTVTQEMIWAIISEGNFQEIKDVSLMERWRFLEISANFHDQFIEELNELNKDNPNTGLEYYTRSEWEEVEKLEGKRFIKTHVLFSLLPPNLLEVGAKVIYVIRNPKDVAVSQYHFERRVKTYNYQGDFEKHWELFTQNLKPNSNYWDHVDEAFQRKHHKNLLLLNYEDIINEQPKIIKKVAEFLNTPITEEQVHSIQDFLRVEKFKHVVNMPIPIGLTEKIDSEFVRKGKVDSWKETFDDELNEKADKWIEENLKKYKIDLPAIRGCINKNV